MKYKALTFLCLIIPFACKKDSPEQPPIATLSLRAEDASCTEAWLKATTTEMPATARLLRDGQRVSDFRLLTSDSLLFDEGLLPKRTYTYQLQKLAADSSVVETSAAVQLTTMDTTSHQFQFQIDTLGVTASTLYDVAIINDTLAYAVGEIFLRDSAGQLDPVLYNVATWNGRSWEAMRIYSNCRLYYPNCGPVLLTVSTGKAVFAFGPNDVWIVAGGVHHFDGTSWSEQRAIVEIGGTNKMWGSSSRDLWFVGSAGMILHSNGSTWQRVESRTNVHLTDIWGTPDGREVWTCGWNNSGGGVILRLNGGVAQKIWDKQSPVPHPTYRGKLNSVWSDGSPEFVLTGTGDVFRHSLIDLRIVRRDQVSLGHFAYALRGNRRNNILLAGDFAMVWHWNGFSWNQYTELSSDDDFMFAIAVSKERVVAVGTRFRGISRQGLIIQGRR